MASADWAAAVLTIRINNVFVNLEVQTSRAHLELDSQCVVLFLVDWLWKDRPEREAIGRTVHNTGVHLIASWHRIG